MVGRNPGYLKLVDAAADADAADELRCGGRTKRGGICARAPGWATEHPGEGPCRDHEGQAEEGSPCLFPLTPLQRRVWDDLSTTLEPLGLMKHAFWPNVYALCVALADLHIHTQLASRAENTKPVKGENRHPKKHPSATIVNQRISQVGTLMDKLGLTAAALAKVGPSGRGEPTDPMDALIRGD